MNKLFRPKCMRRMAVFMALVAPIVYLFGSLFFALNGAHGAEVFAEPVYTEQYVEVDSVSSDGSYKFVVTDVNNLDYFTQNSFSFNWDYSLNGVDYINFSYTVGSSGSNLGVFSARNPYTNLLFVPNSGVASTVNWTFIFDGSFPLVDVFEGSLYALVSVPTSEVPENAGAYSDYVFKNFFAKDNFLVQWGENAISENPYGFAPFGSFWRYLDTNVLHMSNEQVGLMAYGYMYYAAHVLLFDVGFILVTFFLTFIQKVADKIGGEDHA